MARIVDKFFSLNFVKIFVLSSSHFYYWHIALNIPNPYTTFLDENSWCISWLDNIIKQMDNLWKLGKLVKIILINGEIENEIKSIFSQQRRARDDAYGYRHWRKYLKLSHPWQFFTRLHGWFAILQYHSSKNNKLTNSQLFISYFLPKNIF